MASITSYQNVLIHVLDVNDNAPFFVQTEYFGHISEAAAVGTYIHRNDSQSRYDRNQNIFTAFKQK